MNETSNPSQAMSQPTPERIAQAENDLLHFLRLASHQLRHRIRTAANQESQATGPHSSLNRMRLLEELLKEQMPDENSRPATGPAR